MTRIPSKYSESITIEVTPKPDSPHKMPPVEKIIQEWEDDGWEFIEKEKLAHNKYRITLEYHLHEYEIEEEEALEKKKARRRLFFIIITIGIILLLISNSTSTDNSPSVTSRRTQVSTQSNEQSQNNVESEQVQPEPTRTPRLTRTSRSTQTPSPTRTSTPTRTPFLTQTPFPTYSFPPTRTPTLPAGVVTGNQRINVREDTSTDAEIVTVLSAGTSVNIVEYNDDNSWVYIQTEDGVEGWVAEFLIEVEVQAVTVQSSSNTSSSSVTTSCTPNLRQLGGAFRLVNSFSGQSYDTYTYELTDRSNYDEYDALVATGRTWTGLVIPITSTFSSYEGRVTISGVTVSYAYEGDIGSNEGLFFSFEYNNMKYSGDLTIFDASASSGLRDVLFGDLQRLVRQITRC